MSTVRIVNYDARYATDFKRLNVEWITAQWDLDDADARLLDDPNRYILDRGGAILIALCDNEPAGTVALIPYDDNTLELAKMAVAPAFQGQGIGYDLGDAALMRARELGAKRVYLKSSSKLGPALSLYRKLGFLPTDSGTEHHNCDVQMESLL